jgi:rhamnosyltransferase subunit B
VSPYAQVALQLARRGRRVVFIGNEHYAGLFDGSAVDFVRVGTSDDHARLMSDFEVFDRRRKSAEQVFQAHYYPHLESFFAATAAALRRDAHAMVIGGEAGGAAAAEQAGAPYVHLACSPGTAPFARSRFDPQYPERVLPPWLRRLARNGRRRALLYAINRVIRRRGHATASPSLPVDHPLGRLRMRENLSLTPSFRPRLALCMWPDWFASAQPDWPPFVRTTDFPFSSTPEARPRAAPREAMVVATTGSIAGSQTRFYGLVVDACRLLNIRAVLVTPHRDQLPHDLPDRIEWRAFAPFAELFSQASLVVHHGGIGTGALAIAAAVPQLVVPMRGDQFDNSYRFENLGVARLLSLSGMTPSTLAGIMSATMRSTRMQERCAQYQRRLADGSGITGTVDAIESALGD